MFRLHCNKCHQLRRLEPTLAFHLSRCHHILCAPCLDSSAKDQKCPLCGLPLQTIPIGRTMPTGMAQYFEDPQRFLQLYCKISKFQNDQRTSDNLGFQRQTEQQRDMELQVQGYNKLEVQLNQQIKLEKQRIAKLQEYIAYYENGPPKGNDNNNSSGGGSSSQRRRPRPRTPSVPATTDTSMSDEPREKSFFLDTSQDIKSKKHHADTSFHI